MESESSKSYQSSPSSLNDILKRKMAQCLEFSVKSPNGKGEVYVAGILCFSDVVVVIDNANKALKLFDLNGNYHSSTILNDTTNGITFIDEGVFATCGLLSKKVLLWSIFEKKIVKEEESYNVFRETHGIDYNGTYFCLLHQYDSAVTIIRRNRGFEREIVMREAFGKKFEFGCDVHIERDTNNIYVPCWYESGVLCTCMVIEGNALWFTSTINRQYAIIEIKGLLCLADGRNNTLNLMTKNGECVGKLLDEDVLEEMPRHLCYGRDGKLYINCYSSNKIFVFTYM